MELSEELELPPWEKFRLYGKFPWKLCLHFTLVALVTSLVITTNLSYAAYSRSVWLTISNVMYPPNYDRYQSDLSSPFQYYIYTQNQTIMDANRLFSQYYLLLNESVSEVNIFSVHDNPFEITPPRVVIHSTSGVSTYTVEDPQAPNSWPLAFSTVASTNLRQFFNTFKKMDFHFYFRSNSNGAGYSIDDSACFFWHWHISYSSFGAGQILVDADAFIESSCSPLSQNSNTFIMAATVFVISLWYQILLIKAIARQIIVISQLSDPLFWARWQQMAANQTDEPLLGFSSNNPPQTSRISRTISRQPSTNCSRSHSRNDSSKPSSQPKTKKLTHKNNFEDDDSESSQSHQSALSANISQPHDDDNNNDDDNHSTEYSHRLKNYSFSQSGNLRSMSRSSSMSFSARQSRLITLATLEADIRLLTEAFEGLTWNDKLMIFNLWFLVSTVGNVFGLIYSSRIIFYQDDVMASAFLKASLGMACVMYWFTLIQYLEFFPRYYIMISMLKLSVPRVSQFLLGVLPIFFGYALLGMVCFGDVTDRFGNVTETLRSLFAVVNGDIIYDTFDAIEFSGFGGQLYLYLYILIFTYVVLMTIIAIVEEAFFEAQEKKGLGPYEYQPGGGGGGGGDDVPNTDLSHSRIHMETSKNTTDRASLLSAYSSGGISSVHADASNLNSTGIGYQPPDNFRDSFVTSGDTTNPLLSGSTVANNPSLRRQASLRPSLINNNNNVVSNNTINNNGPNQVNSNPTSAVGSLQDEAPIVTASTSAINISNNAGTSGKRELPENVRLLLRNVQRIPSLTGQVLQQDFLNSNYQSGFATNSIAPTINNSNNTSNTGSGKK